MFGLNKRLVFSLYLSGRKSSLEVLKIEKAKKQKAPKAPAFAVSSFEYSRYTSGAPNDNFRKIICSEDDLRSRIFGSFSEKLLACLTLLGFSNFKKIV